MKLLAIILSSFIIVQAKVEDLSDVKVNGICYEREVLKTGLDTPYLLTVDYGSNTLYFSYSQPVNASFTNVAAKLNLNTNEFKDIEGFNGFAQTVNPETHEVYIGGDHGIYKYDPKTDKAEFLGEKDANIWGIFFKDTLYYCLFPSSQVFTFADGKSTNFTDMEGIDADTFFIDNDDDMFYSNSTGLYSQKKGTKDAIRYSDLTGELVRQITTDINGNVYALLQTGVYAVKKTTKSLEKLFDFDYISGVAFDKDNNIIYSQDTSLIRMTPNKDKSC